MPRPLRIEYENAWYHVMNRGAGKRAIFNSDQHRLLFLDVLREASKLFGIELHAYCLMNNHYHLLIKTPRANLSRAMRHINGVFTLRLNRLKKTDGPLFRGRFKAIIVDQDSYLLQVSRYIHLNPVAAQLIKHPEQFMWSSYSCYLSKKEKPDWLHSEQILSMVTNKQKVSGYKKFVEAGLDTETITFYEKMNTPIIFGTPEFKAQLLNELPKEKIKSAMTDFKRTRVLPAIENIVQACVHHFKIKESDLYKTMRGRTNEPRNIAIYGSRMWGSEKLSTIATYFKLNNPSQVSNIVKVINDCLDTDTRLATTLEKIAGKLSVKK